MEIALLIATSIDAVAVVGDQSDRDRRFSRLEPFYLEFRIWIDELEITQCRRVPILAVRASGPLNCFGVWVL